MLWGSIEASVANGDLAKGTSEDSWAAIGTSASDQIVCQWTNAYSSSKVWSFDFVSVSDYFGGAPDTTSNDVSGSGGSSAGSDWDIDCWFTRPAYNTADPTEDLSLVGDLASVPVSWVQGGSFGDMTEGVLTGSVIDLDYVTQEPESTGDDTLADEVAEEEEVMESSMLLSASVATIAVVASLA